MRRFMRNMAFHFARRDLAAFLADHEDDLLLIFREEMQTLDDELPEERLFIDIKMIPMGEMVLKAALRASTRFLVQDLEERGNLEITIVEEDYGT